MVNGVFRMTLSQQQIRRPEERIDVVWLQLKDSRKGIDSLAHAVEFLEHPTAVVMRVDVIPAQTKRPLVARQRFLGATQSGERIAAVVERFRISGRHRQRPVAARQRRDMVAALEQREAEIRVRRGVARLKPAACRRRSTASPGRPVCRHSVPSKLSARGSSGTATRSARYCASASAYCPLRWSANARSIDCWSEALAAIAASTRQPAAAAVKIAASSSGCFQCWPQT